MIRCKSGGCVQSNPYFIRHSRDFAGDLVDLYGEFIYSRYQEIDEILEYTCDDCEESAQDCAEWEEVYS